MNPLVSICIPTYNGAAYIEAAVMSAIHQTYRPLEIIVSDDHSTDNTLEIIERLRIQADVEIKIQDHSRDTMADNWNNCIKLAGGTFIKFLLQDDLLEPECIQELIQPFQKYKNLGLSFCSRKIINEMGPEKTEWIARFGNLHTHWKALAHHQKGSDLLKDPGLLSQPRNKVGEPTAVLIKKSVFEQVGYFNPRLKQALDYECWYRIFTRYDVAFINKKLVSFRLHVAQTTESNAKIDIPDYELYPQLIYRNCFKYLHIRLKWRLFLKYSGLGKKITKGLKS